MSEQAEMPDIKKKVISTGIRVGTNVKTKFMRQFINQASPEGLYMLDIDQTLARINWLLAREILIQKGELTETQDMKYEIDDFETKIKEVLEDDDEEFQKKNYRSRS